MINLDFDYVAYLDALKAYGLNYTRIWPGALLEMVGEFCKDNTMGPRPDRTIVPWARSNEPGYVYGGNKFDLDKWNPEFFARLKDFIVKAAERGIVVEICFFNSAVLPPLATLAVVLPEQHPGRRQVRFQRRPNAEIP